MIRVCVPATTANLGPGYDVLGMALDLYNEIEMEEIDDGLMIEVFGEGADTISRDESNVVYRAACMVFDSVGWNPRGLKIKLTNRIPVARGLGSSAAATVGGLLAANALSGQQLEHATLINMGTQIEGHPDNIAPALLGGVTIACILNDSVKYTKLPCPAGIKAVAAVPDFQLSTKLAREVLPKQVSMSDAVFNLSRASLLVAALINNDEHLLAVTMEDRLHQPYRSTLIPGMHQVFTAAKKAGAIGVALSGAGPTLIAFAKDNFTTLARAMEEAFQQSGVGCRTLTLNPNMQGASAYMV